MIQTRPLSIASWPSPTFGHNAFLVNVCHQLEREGHKLRGVNELEELPPSGIDVLHVHWPEKIFWHNGGKFHAVDKARSALRLIRRLKKAGTQIVWTAHNLRPHELSRAQAVIWSFYFPALLSLLDGFVTLSPSTLALVRSAIPQVRNLPAVYAWHPPYRPPRTFVRDIERRRWSFAESDHVIASIGYVRAQKGLDDLIAKFRQVADGESRLVIAGAPMNQALDDRLRALALGDARITLDLRHLEEDEVWSLQCAADLVAAPFKTVLHSGSLVHALSAGVQVLTRRTPFAEDLRVICGEDWVRLYDDDLRPDHLRPRQHRHGWGPNLDALDPAISTLRLVEFYTTLLRNAKQRKTSRSIARNSPVSVEGRVQSGDVSN